VPHAWPAAPETKSARAWFFAIGGQGQSQALAGGVTWTIHRLGAGRMRGGVIGIYNKYFDWRSPCSNRNAFTDKWCIITSNVMQANSILRQKALYRAKQVSITGNYIKFTAFSYTYLIERRAR
jgi:hypothetical protein